MCYVTINTPESVPVLWSPRRCIINNITVCFRWHWKWLKGSCITRNIMINWWRLRWHKTTVVGGQSHCWFAGGAVYPLYQRGVNQIMTRRPVFVVAGSCVYRWHWRLIHIDTVTSWCWGWRQYSVCCSSAWKRIHVETFSAALAHVTGHRREFGVSFYVSLKKLFKTQSRCRYFEIMGLNSNLCIHCQML